MAGKIRRPGRLDGPEYDYLGHFRNANVQAAGHNWVPGMLPEVPMPQVQQPQQPQIPGIGSVASLAGMQQTPSTGGSSDYVSTGLENLTNY